MKRSLIIFCVVLVTHLFSSCSGLLAPQYAENEDVLVFVYDYTSKMAYRISCVEDGYDGQALRTLEFLSSMGEETPRSEKIRSVEMLDWSLNEQTQGESYTGYFVTYSVRLDKRIWYALVALTEFDSGRYEWEVIDIDRSLSEIKSMLY